MSDSKKTYSGVKITQQPGGSSNFSLNWGHKEEPVKRNIDPVVQIPKKEEPSNPEKTESGTLKVVEQAGDVKKSKGVKIVNPPGGKSNFTFG